ncbi:MULTISPECIES: MFS transporter [unclassified Pantoea]|uniref:MFS transporter n=1 Tax=unclassified Pantoea TaxID=2630326 RepID=UPI001CD603FA|nr:MULTISPECIES: MFS transporter [unclassified Pantoea]MCA1177763.1 MFS transporter [Pantoea sp. alder69]MCA1252766.1 MFS transporter [Pantoea sp. alder70]MCA1266473.1 MFS transporter [Pantoea sp. alder81]
MPVALFALTVGAFAICTSEFVIVGMLLNISHDLSISVASAGMLVTAYALGVVIGAPLLTPLMVRFKRKNALVILMLLYVAGNFACAIATSYQYLLFARVIAALAHASFFGLGAVVATQLVPKEKQASAIAAMFLGATLANVFGTPLGTLIGDHFGWRITFVACSALGLFGALAIALLVPDIKSEQPKHLANEFRVLLQPQALKAMLITVIGFGGIFTALTYIGPLLTQVTGFPESAVSWLLLLFGVGMVLGNPLGGRLTDFSLRLGILVTLLILLAVLIALGMLADFKAVTALLVFLFGAAMFSAITPLQVQAMHATQDASVLGSSFNIAAFNLGNAGGAWLGSFALDQGARVAQLPLIAAAVTTVGLLIALFTRAGVVAKNSSEAH